PVSIRILLPVHEVLRRRDFERVAFDPRAAMGGRAQPNDLRREADRPIVAVPCDVVEVGEDRHIATLRPLPYYAILRCNFWTDLHPPAKGRPRAGREQPQRRGSPYRFNRRRNGAWNRVGRGLQLARRNILRPVEEIAGVELAFGLAQTRIDLVRIGRAHACVPFVLGHEIDVGAAGRERLGGGPVLPRPSKVARILLLALPAPLALHPL